VAQAVQRLPSKHKALSSNSSSVKKEKKRTRMKDKYFFKSVVEQLTF
jgi:hypothetical protein